MRVETSIRATRWERAVRIGLLCLCFLVGGAAGLSAQQDKIILKNGKDRQVRIRSEDFDGVRYTTQATGNSPQLVAWAEVDSIEYSGAKEYQDAMASFSAGRWADSLAKFDTMAADAELRPVLRQSVLFHSAIANLRLGKPEDAMAKY